MAPAGIRRETRKMKSTTERKKRKICKKRPPLQGCENQRPVGILFSKFMRFFSLRETLLLRRRKNAKEQGQKLDWINKTSLIKEPGEGLIWEIPECGKLADVGASSVHPHSSREAETENVGMPNKKEMAKDRWNAVDSPNVNSEEKYQIDVSVDTKLKKRRHTYVIVSEADSDIDWSADKKIDIHNDAEKVNKREAKKKKSQGKGTGENQKAQGKETGENQASAYLIESNSEKQSLPKVNYSDIKIQEVGMGMPGGKKATPRSKVSIKYVCMSLSESRHSFRPRET